MNVPDILSQLDRSDGRFPHDAIRESIACREEIVPALLGVLDEVDRDPLPFTGEDRMVHIFAMYLLAQFRETRAYPVLVRIVSVPGESVHDLAGRVITEDLGAILASVSNGDPGGMKSLVENRHADEYVRVAALNGLLTLVACGLRDRDEVMAYFDRLFGILEPDPPMVWNGLATARFFGLRRSWTRFATPMPRVTSNRGISVGGYCRRAGCRQGSGDAISQGPLPR